MARSGRGTFVAALAVMTILAALGATAAPAAEGEAGGGVMANTTAAIVMAVAIVVGSSCIAAGYAVARVGSAALGAASERPELLGRSLILVGLAEGIAIYGLIIGIMLLRLVR